MLGGGTLLDVFAVMLKGVVVGFMVDGMCKTSLGVVLKPLMAIFGMKNQTERIQEAFRSGDPVEAVVAIVEMFCMVFGLTSQCFTGDTPVSTEDGLRPIEEIQAGDYVWSENTETGEKELKKVLSVSVTETDILVHVATETGTVINTTENHPFYTEGKGWCAAAELETGDVLRTQDGRTETVASVETETLDEPVKVYNLEIEDSHTYYVSADWVLVHNACGDSQKLKNNMEADNMTLPDDKNKYAAHHIVASSSKKAKPARDIFDLVGIDYNSSENGVFLPMGDFGTGAHHNRLHTNKYYEKVNLLITKAYSMEGDKKQNVTDMLDLIRDLLEQDRFY